MVYLSKINIAPFEITPSPLTVAVEQEVAVFVCQHLNSDGITWLVNGTSLNRINSPNISISTRGNTNQNIVMIVECFTFSLWLSDRYCGKGGGVKCVYD